MDFEHKTRKHRGRSSWRHYQPGELGEHLDEEAERLAEAGGALLHVPRQVDVTRVNAKRRERVQGKWLERTWPNRIGFLPDGRALALEAVSTTNPSCFRCSLIPRVVLTWLEQVAQAGGVALVYVRSGTPRDYVLPVDALGTIGGRGPQEKWWWEELEDHQLRPGQSFWEGRGLTGSA